MPYYRKMGSVPRKRHTRHERNDGPSYLGEGIYYEHVITTAGFARSYSIAYHLRPPTRVAEVAVAGEVSLQQADGLPLRHHHLKSQLMPRGGCPISGRVPLLFNDDVICYRVRPDQPQGQLYRNGGADEVIFIHSGNGHLQTSFGRVNYRRGDYIVIPRMTIYQFVSDDLQNEEHLVLESTDAVRLPPRYLNPEGQIKLGAPYGERDFHGPVELPVIDKDEPTPLLVKDGTRLTTMTMAHHPLDVVGWDGHLFPYTFNAWDFEPLTGTVHLPPPFQQTFETTGFVICTFAPRHLDHHPQAIKVPYVHSNVQADEVLFYVEGNFGSRRGVDAGSLTWHPGGIPHGPHPGTILASENVTRTNEMAVMFDTERPLKLTQQALKIDDPQYPLTWLDS